jgi:hypothetical protein
MSSSFETARIEALFVSDLQGSDLRGTAGPPADQIRRAVATTLRRFGINECAARVATEFGDHPDTAVARMSWAIASVRTAY